MMVMTTVMMALITVKMVETINIFTSRRCTLSWAYYFALSVLLVFVFQGVHYLFKKRVFKFSTPFIPLILAGFGALFFTIVESYFF